jgi:hypothetical protein
MFKYSIMSLATQFNLIISKRSGAAWDYRASNRAQGGASNRASSSLLKADATSFPNVKPVSMFVDEMRIARRG